MSEEKPEPYITLDADEDESIGPDADLYSQSDCECRLARDPLTSKVRLYLCALHASTNANVEIIDEACRYFGCKPEGLGEAIAAVQGERSEALLMLGVDDELEGDKLTEAISTAGENYDEDAKRVTDKLLSLVGLSRDVWTGHCLDSYWEGRFNPVEFLVSRLRALAPEKLHEHYVALRQEAKSMSFIEHQRQAGAGPGSVTPIDKSLRERIDCVRIDKLEAEFAEMRKNWHGALLDLQTRVRQLEEAAAAPKKRPPRSGRGI